MTQNHQRLAPVRYHLDLHVHSIFSADGISLPEDLIEITTANRLHYSPGPETGVLFHMIGALSQYGKLGLTAIGNSRDEVEELYAQTLAVLDREAGRTRRGPGPRG